MEFVDPEQVAISNEQREAIRLGVSALPYKERRVIELRWGFDDNAPMTYEEVGRELDMTPDYAKRMAEQAYNKLSRLHSVRTASLDYGPAVRREDRAGLTKDST